MHQMQKSWMIIHFRKTNVYAASVSQVIVDCLHNLHVPLGLILSEVYVRFRDEVAGPT